MSEPRAKAIILQAIAEVLDTKLRIEFVLGLPSRLLTVFILKSADHQRDLALLGDLRELLVEFKGNDKFRFHLMDERGLGGLELAFPQDRTNYCPALERELVSMLGPNSFQVEYQKQSNNLE